MLFFSSDQPGLFRVNEEGYHNRYRSRAHLAPHTDKIYKVIYPANTNADYISDPNRINRRQNIELDKYATRRKVNGEFDMKVLVAMQPALVE